MKVYLNPCYYRNISFEKKRKEMPQKEHTFSRSTESSCSTEAGQLNGTVLREFGDDDVIYTEGTTNHRLRRIRKRKLICLFLCAMLALAIAIIVTTIAVKALQTDDDSTDTGTLCRKDCKGDKKASTNNKGATAGEVCDSPKCRQIASNIFISMNTSVDPCDDFNEFVCGRWSQSHPLPPASGFIDPLSIMGNEKNRNLKRLIESYDHSQTVRSAKSFKYKILKFYESCMNMKAIDEAGKTPLLDLISSLGTWSPVQSWTEVKGDRDLTWLLVQSHRYFSFSVHTNQLFSPLFKFFVTSSFDDARNHTIMLTGPDLPLPPANYNSSDPSLTKMFASYKLLQLNYAALLGPSKDAERYLKELIDFEIQLANITQTPFGPHQSMKIRELVKRAGSQIDWLRFIKEMFAPLNIEITPETTITAFPLKYFLLLEDLIKNTPERTVRDYIIWLCIWKYGSYASAPFIEADYNFKQTVFGTEKRADRWLKCVTDLEQAMGYGLASLYVEMSITDKDKQLANEVIENVRKEFKNNLVNSNWMDVKTKAAAFTKVDELVKNIGYPDYVKNENIIDELYKKMKISGSSYFENALSMFKEDRLKNLQLIASHVDRTTYEVPPTLAEAFYSPQKNKMIFLAGMLHSPFFDADVPMALNYGAMGLVAGHEITHAFDNTGRHYDKIGNIRNWWSEASANAFAKRTKCIKDQYSQYSIYGLKLSGKSTLSENIADNGALRVAYQAYKNWRESNKDQTLPGLSYTPDQVYFINQAQIWCGTYREEYMRKNIFTQPHSPNKYRIIGSFSNFEEFSKAFKCPQGSRMNPEKKCRVW